MLNEWGYETCGDVPPILTPGEFRALTQNKLSATDEEIAVMIDAVGAAARSFCGWHISPELRCIYVGEADGDIVRLPAMAVSCVHRVCVNGQELNRHSYEWTKNGLVRVRHACGSSRWQSTLVEYSAGIDINASIGAVVAQIASNALVAAPGVASEHAGQVGMTYNQTGTGISGGVSVLSRDASLLAPWKLTHV